MRALVDQLAAPGNRACKPPFLLIVWPAAMSVAPAHEHQPSDLTAIDDLARPRHRRMKAVIVADFRHSVRGGGGGGDRPYLRKVAPPGLLDQHMLARTQAGRGDRRKLSMRRCNHNSVDIGSLRRDA